MPPAAVSVAEYAVPTTPLGSGDAVVIVNTEAIVRLRVGVIADCAGEAESVTLKVNGVPVTATLGVPLITPAALTARPVGRVPVFNCQVSVPVPPVAASVAEYAVPTTPLGSEEVEIVSVNGAIVSVRFLVAVCAEPLESVTVKVSGVAVAGAVGVPPICPVAPFNVNPAGSVPAVNCHVYGPVPPMAARVWE